MEAQVATDLGPSFYVPAACRGCGSAVALDCLIDQLALALGEAFWTAAPTSVGRGRTPRTVIGAA
ncbi:MAG TPA: hypothetical protein VFW69_18390 [Mycobacterium sp.]|nr:hypothetical protein [Mycobacterium sp.]